ncbi:MAG: carboxypeptidase-like regulatory domain-containing protein [Gemmatimonadaceae bacterium]
MHRRSVAATVVFAFSVMGCYSDPAGNLVASAEPRKTILLGMVVDRSGACIQGATALVVKGQRAGETTAQITPCDEWNGDGGFQFQELTVGVEMTLRFSAVGYRFDDMKVVPTAGQQGFHLFKSSSGPP